MLSVRCVSLQININDDHSLHDFPHIFADVHTTYITTTLQNKNKYMKGHNINFMNIIKINVVFQ